MSAAIVGFALGSVAGGILGMLAMGLLASGRDSEEVSELQARLNLATVRADSARRRCHELSHELGSVVAAALDMLSQIEEDDRVLGTGHAARYRQRIGRYRWG